MMLLLFQVRSTTKPPSEGVGESVVSVCVLVMVITCELVW